MTAPAHLIGQETELAIRFEPKAGVEHPGNKVIFEFLSIAIKSLIKTRPGKRNFIQEQFFTENGGAIYYEHHPQSLKKGLIEFATPECSSAQELILYQRAQERLLIDALPVARSLMAGEGFEGELSLLKNSRDFEGNTYGSQENYDCNIAGGPGLFWLKVGLIAYLPLSLLTKLIYVIFLVPFIFIVFILKVFLEILGLAAGPNAEGSELRPWRRRLRAWLKRMDLDTADTEEFLLRFEYSIFYPLFWLSYKPLIILYNLLAFRKARKALTAFVVSRIIYTGAGSLLDQQRFILSEKSLAISGYLRRSIHRNDKPLFDCGNLIKEYELSAWEFFVARWGSLGSLFAGRQRLQVSFSDSNRCQLAEFLKLGVTDLIVQMSDAGFLDDAPQLEDPVEALRTITEDLDLKQKVVMKKADIEAMSALEIQRWYLARAQEFVGSQAVESMENRDILRLWQETLDKLEQDPLSLLGRVDWITKRYLLETSGAELEFWERKKIDLRYHELGEGYYDKMRHRGLTLDLHENDAIEKAVREPSSPDRVRMRSRLIKSVALKDQFMTVSWSQVKLGRWRPRLIRLDDYRPQNRQGDFFDSIPE